MDLQHGVAFSIPREFRLASDRLDVGFHFADELSGNVRVKNLSASQLEIDRTRMREERFVELVLGRVERNTQGQPAGFLDVKCLFKVRGEVRTFAATGTRADHFAVVNQLEATEIV